MPFSKGQSSTGIKFVQKSSLLDYVSGKFNSNHNKVSSDIGNVSILPNNNNRFYPKVYDLPTIAFDQAMKFCLWSRPQNK